MVASFMDSSTHLLIARPEYKTIRDLKGKTLAVSNYGATSDVAARMMMNELERAAGKVSTPPLPREEPMSPRPTKVATKAEKKSLRGMSAAAKKKSIRGIPGAKKKSGRTEPGKRIRDADAVEHASGTHPEGVAHQGVGSPEHLPVRAQGPQVGTAVAGRRPGVDGVEVDGAVASEGEVSDVETGELDRPCRMRGPAGVPDQQPVVEDVEQPDRTVWCDVEQRQLVCGQVYVVLRVA